MLAAAIQAAIDAAVEARKESIAESQQQRQERLEEQIDWVQRTLNNLIEKDILEAIQLRYNDKLTPEGDYPEHVAEFVFSGHSGPEFSVKISNDPEGFLFYYDVFLDDSVVRCPAAPHLQSICCENRESYRPRFLFFLAQLQSPEFAEQARKDIAQERTARRSLQRKRLFRRLLDLIRF